MSVKPPSTGTSRPAVPDAGAQSRSAEERREDTEPFIEPMIDFGDLDVFEDLVDGSGAGQARTKPAEPSAASVRAATIPGPATPPPRSTATTTPVAGTSAANPAAHPSALCARTSASACPVCGGPVEVRSPHIAVAGGAVRVYCSRACLDARDALPADANTISLALPPRSRRLRWAVAALAVSAVAGAGAFALLRPDREPPAAPPSLAIAATALPPKPEPTPVTIADPNREADAKLVTDLMHDAWIHPLAGPIRWMPRNHTGAFGAERAGERPPECVSGHCGVDIGRVWGTPVHAVHDGIVEFINRGPNEERGGVFVRISHRDGTLFSWYFHLAAVPRSLHRGDKVKAGQVIGALGDTGIKHSAPHLHFALSVKPSRDARERYLDPESLIAIWPLWMPDESGTGGRIATRIEPGMPVRADKRGKRAKKRAHASRTHAITSPDELATDDPETESPDPANTAGSSSAKAAVSASANTAGSSSAKAAVSASANTAAPSSAKTVSPSSAKTAVPASAKTAVPASAKTVVPASAKTAAPSPANIPSPTPAGADLPPH